jgi:hypothetical protein
VRDWSEHETGQNGKLSVCDYTLPKRHQPVHFGFIHRNLHPFNIFLTVHLRIILVGNEIKAQFFLWYIYLNPLHVSSNYVLILRRTIVWIQFLVKSLCVSGRPVCSSRWNMFIHLVVCLTTGPKPLPKRALHIVRSRASSSNENIFYFPYVHPVASYVFFLVFVTSIPPLYLSLNNPFYKAVST